MRISNEDKAKAIWQVRDTFEFYKKQSEDYRKRMYDVYDAISTFKGKKRADRSSTFKINKAHEVVEKILPRIIARDPKWIVSPRTDEFSPEDSKLTWEQRQERIKKQNQMALWIQDYLTYIFDNYNLREPARLRAKNMLIYWNGYAKIKYKYEIARTRNDNWVTEKITWEYPTIDVKSWTEIFVDPRYVILEDMPAVIEVIHWVRLTDLKRKKEYFNLEDLEDLCNMDFQEDEDWYKNKIFNLTWITANNLTEWVDKNSLSIMVYYWYFEKEWEDEKLYKITLANNLILIWFEEITCIPFEDIKAFDNTEIHYATWFVEPIMGLQDELNFQKNSATEYINHWLNRSWIWSPNSWVNPKDLISRPNQIIPTNRTVEDALRNLQELPHREVSSSYFQNQNDIERQIQWQTFTVDTAQPQSQQGLTNTATWIRVKFFESNSVIDEIRKHFEEWLQKLAYKLLQSTFENMKNNIVIKKTWDKWFWEINKELLRDAINRYSIKVEVNSSSYDSIENRREDAIAFYNILLTAKQVWLPVNLEEWLKEVISSFEKKDINKFIMQPQQQQIDPMSMFKQQWQWQPLKEWETKKQSPEQLTQDVALWNITWIQ